MQVIEDETIEGVRDRDSGALFCEREFHRCHFQGCHLSIATHPAQRSTIRHVRLVNCSQRGCSVGSAAIEDVLVDGLRTYGQLLQSFGAVFNRVVLRGKFDRMMIANDVLPSSTSQAERQREIELFHEANAEYYRGVDWALDISHAEFKELDVRGVPGRLIRRDPESQVLVTRQRVLEGVWRGLPFKNTLTPFSLDFMLKQGMDDMVLIAPKRHRKFPSYLEDLRLLRAAGISEPD